MLDELRRRRAETETALAPPDATFAESGSAYLDATLDRPNWARLVIWQALGGHAGDAGQQVAAQRSKLSGGQWNGSAGGSATAS